MSRLAFRAAVAESRWLNLGQMVVVSPAREGWVSVYYHWKSAVNHPIVSDWPGIARIAVSIAPAFYQRPNVHLPATQFELSWQLAGALCSTPEALNLARIVRAGGCRTIVSPIGIKLTLLGDQLIVLA